MKLLRVLFPSWKFFADIADLPVLFVRTANYSGEWGPWLPALHRPQRKPWSIFFNPEGNLYLACNSLLQQIEVEIGDLSSDEIEHFEESVSFQLLHNLVRDRLKRNDNPSQYQFRVERLRQGDLGATGGEVFLTSKVYSS